MRFLDLKFSLDKFLIFSLNDIKKIDPDFDRRRLTEWQKKKYIKKIIKGNYIFSDIAVNEESLFIIANKIYNPSYISFEKAFSYYNLIPEGVFSITSASTKKTTTFSTPVGNFSYYALKNSLMFGYSIKYDKDHIPYKMADIEKALIDYFYIHADLNKEADFFEMRFNAREFLANADNSKFQRYLNIFQNKSLEKRVNNFLIFLKNA